MSKPKAAIFVDVQNVYYTCRQAFQRQFNYRHLWHSLSEKYDIVMANAYAIDSNNDGQHKFQSALRAIGFEVKLKPYIQRSDGSAKGDWDVGITLDLVEMAGKVDHVFLLSGDGDFDLLLQKVSELSQTKTHVISVAQLTARSLMDACDHHYGIGADDLL